MAKRKSEDALAAVAKALIQTEKYTGELAKPTPRHPEFTGTLRKPITDVLRERHARGLVLLLHHYGIPFDSGNCWLELAYVLARNHVPYFRLSKVGRPTKPESILKALGPKKTRGRPSKNGGQLNALNLVTLIEYSKRQLATKLRRKVTDIDVIDYLTNEAEKKHGRSFSQVRTSERKYWQKRISAARKEIRNSQKSEKSP